MFGKFKINLITAGVFITLAVVFACGCGKNAPEQTSSAAIKAANADYVSYTLCLQVLKDIAQSDMVIPAGAQPHGFEPLPRDIAKIEKADFLFYINDTLEPWAKKLGGAKAFALDRNLPEVNPQDPHIWMDFDNASVMAQNMAYYVSSVYPDTEQQLLKNILNFQNEIQMLKRMYAQMFANCQSKQIYHIGHLAFGYLAKKYGLQFKPLKGANADSEPTPKDMAEMIKEIKQNNIKYIFTEEALNPQIAKAISQETGAEILYLYTVEHITKQEFEQKLTYRQLMIKNMENLAKGLNCKA